jgi:hypothetical protein
MIIQVDSIKEPGTSQTKHIFLDQFPSCSVALCFLFSHLDPQVVISPLPFNGAIPIALLNALASTHTHECMDTHTHTYANTHAYTHAHKHTHTHTKTDRHTHLHTYHCLVHRAIKG